MPVKQDAKPPVGALESNSSASISTTNTENTTSSTATDNSIESKPQPQYPNTTLCNDPSHSEVCLLLA